jgi:hypothetical protein
MLMTVEVEEEEDGRRRMMVRTWPGFVCWVDSCEEGAEGSLEGLAFSGGVCD